MPPIARKDHVRFEVRSRLGVIFVLTLVTLCIAGAWASAAWAVEKVRPTLVRTVATSSFSPPSPDPAGIVYMPAADRFLISDSEVDEMTLYQGFNLFTATRSGSGVGTGTTLNGSKEPTGLGFNPIDRTLYVSDDDADKIFVVRPGVDGVHGTLDDVVTGFSAAAFGSMDAEGVEYDPATGDLFVCDGVGVEVYKIDPVNGVFGDGNDVVSNFDVARFGARDCEGIGLDAQRGTLLVVDPVVKKVYELTKSGNLVRVIDLSAIPAADSLFASVTMAPTSAQGDSPSAMNYWVADRHVDNDADPDENDGRLFELAVGSVRPDAPFSPRPGGPYSARPGAFFAHCATKTASIIRGGITNDLLTGTARADRIFAGAGDDVVDGLAAGDCIDLGPGDDRGQGSGGDDLIVGGPGRDRVFGNSGSDRLRGGSSGDVISGGSSRDRIVGDQGNDRINGGSGNDSIKGSSGRDRLKGASGPDDISGGAGSDRISGGAGSDRISGGAGSDRISARDGKRDRLNCGSGRDFVVADPIDRIARNCEGVRQG